MNGQISVIIPMHNVVEYIGACLDSVLKQTVASQIQIYVVDDGSSDGSVAVVKQYAEDNANVHLLIQDHGGPGAARNLGLSVASEEFVTFLDADDMLPVDAYSNLLVALLDDPEVEFSTGLMESFPKKQEFFWQSAYKSGRRVISSILDAPELIHSGSACNKMFRRSSFDNLGLEFPELAHFEDARVVIPILLKAKKFTIIPETVYLYRKRDQGGSIMDSLFSRVKNYWDYLELIEEVQSVSLEVSHEKRRLAEQFSVRGFQGFLLRYGQVIPREDQEEFLRRAYSVFVDVPAWLIRQNTHNPRHAYPFGLLRAKGKLDEYDSLTADTSLHLIPTKPQLGELKMGEYDTLMRSSGLTVWIESVTRVGHEMRLEGRISARGLPISELPSIKLELVLGKRRFKANWKERIDRPTLEGRFSAFSATVPLKKWPSGEYFPRLAFNDNDIVIESRLLKTMGFWRNSRKFVNSGDSYIFIVNAKNQIGVQKSLLPRTRLSRIQGSIGSFLDAWRSDRFFAFALLIRALHSRIPSRQIWLIGERWDTAQDNSARLFEYLGNRKLDSVLPLYVVTGDSEAYREMSKFGRVVRHGSIQHKLAFILASQLISAFDTDTYLKPRSWDKNRTIEHFIGKTNIKRVFLQHGVTFRGDGVHGLHRLASGYDLVLTVSERERKFFARELGYGARAVRLGFPRFDSLQPIKSEQTRKILFAPTWRSDLVVPSYSDSGASSNADSFMSSNYYISIMEFLRSDKLRNFLKENNSELHFLPHYEVRDFFTDQTLGLDRVHVASTEEMSFQEWLRSASVFITDYSSTSFDVALMRIPVIYFGWDPVNPETGQFYVTSYFFYDKDGFGPVAHSANEVIEHLNKISDNDFKMHELYQDRISDFFGDLRLGDVSTSVVDKLLTLK